MRTHIQTVPGMANYLSAHMNMSTVNSRLFLYCVIEDDLERSLRH